MDIGKGSEQSVLPDKGVAGQVVCQEQRLYCGRIVERSNAGYLTAADVASRDCGNSKLKILHAILSEGFYGGERYCIDLAIAQSRMGHDVNIMVADAGSAYAQQFRRLIVQAGGGTQGNAVRLVAVPRY